MLIVGLTGGIACGKSTVSAELCRNRFPIIDADLSAKQTTEKGNWGYRRVVSTFGPACLLPNGELDRAALGQLVFNDVTSRRKLNAATHPPVAVALMLQLLWYWLRHTPCVVQLMLPSMWSVAGVVTVNQVLDMPLLIESGVHRVMGMVVVVSCSPAVQLARLMQRDSSTAVDAQARINSQLSLPVKEQMAQVVLHNNGDLEQLQQQVSELVEQLHKCSRSWRVWLLSPSGLLVAAAGMWAALTWGLAKESRA